ncbi:hypothetical protein D2E24_0880 [Bifidobacterium samirii]|uniref:Uncharacterized protein n=1 Tax=Bifidobacterium samirii TaxID=2306974 RepID=A0A430FUN2_9BIFI|nr:hypothetical protein D2E24_0880 [Bifidobacterium samirii]
MVCPQPPMMAVCTDGPATLCGVNSLYPRNLTRRSIPSCPVYPFGSMKGTGEMSRTYKDRPYRLDIRAALVDEYLDSSAEAWPHASRESLADVVRYGYTRHNRNMHLPLRRRSNWRWIEGDRIPEYGNARRIRQHLKMACRGANSGLMDDDWDDPIVGFRTTPRMVRASASPLNPSNNQTQCNLVFYQFFKSTTMIYSCSFSSIIVKPIF